MFEQSSNPSESKRWLKVIVLFIIVACRFYFQDSVWREVHERD